MCWIARVFLIVPAVVEVFLLTTLNSLFVSWFLLRLNSGFRSIQLPAKAISTHQAPKLKQTPGPEIGQLVNDDHPFVGLDGKIEIFISTPKKHCSENMFVQALWSMTDEMYRVVLFKEVCISSTDCLRISCSVLEISNCDSLLGIRRSPANFSNARNHTS